MMENMPSLTDKEIESVVDMLQDGDIPGVNERRTMLYIDLRILPLLALIYAFALIDRLNLGSARIAGMGADLQLTVSDRYSIASSLYFVPYILLQIPGNVFLRAVGARNLITFIVIGWGGVQTGMAFVPNWRLLTLCRVLLGALEAPFFPALVYIISTWYKRHELQKRLAAFFMLSITASAFSAVLAYGLSLLGGKSGLAGWSWIFFIEGLITIGLGIIGYFLIPDFPDRNTFLSAAQTRFILKRIEEDRGDHVPDKITTKKVLYHLSDWTLWVYGIMSTCAAIPTYMLAYFTPVILRSMGYSTTHSMLLSAPPYGSAFVSAMTFAWLADRTKHRSGYIVIQAIMTLIGTCMTAFAVQNSVRYAGTFFISAGSAGCIPTILTYNANNVASQSKRAVSSALVVAWGGIGGIVASTAFREKDAPKYIPGLWVTVAAQILMILLAVITMLYLRRMNRLSREGKLSEPLEGKPGFYYTL
ncbi:high-affinity nicotinic acid transporter [Moniliophthora roreri MCA 2997]|uniref:High-affinity nicotinic acid transporter n=2 Tax=Moniliophthora roreri TaxID=221103 RepID=V2X0F9_MONRO|nr:high-affinity nicotinic acid transporter [Moniliophthora roreri MCA 2997]KAI3606364.1 high-affinity nicotinic acid transporter [Moniliophthora roreri]